MTVIQGTKPTISTIVGRLIGLQTIEIYADFNEGKYFHLIIVDHKWIQLSLSIASYSKMSIELPIMLPIQCFDRYQMLSVW